MTDLDLDTLRRLAEAATPGPWHVTHTIELRLGFEDAASDGVFNADNEAVAGLATADDAAYLAAVSPDVVLALLDRLAAVDRAHGARRHRARAAE